MAEAGYSVTAVDADPDANLALTLGFPDADKIVPLSEMKELIQERTGTQPGSSSPYFKINPRVDDIPDKYSVKHGGIRLLVMGRPKAGGAGCYCPENAVLAALMAHLLLARNEMVIMDMAAGIEHLSRGTARAVDKLIIVVEPGRASIETAGRIAKLVGRSGNYEHRRRRQQGAHPRRERLYRIIPARFRDSGFHPLRPRPYPRRDGQHAPAGGQPADCPGRRGNSAKAPAHSIRPRGIINKSDYY